MKTMLVADILNGRIKVENKVIIRGWVRTRRDSKAGISFIAIYDGSCVNTVQVIANNNLKNYKSEILHLTSGCSVSIAGYVKKSPSKGQSVEIYAIQIDVIGWIDKPETYPIAPKKHSMEYLREIAHLRPRTNLIGSVTRIRHTLALALHQFFDQHGYYWISTPLITSSNTEGAGEMFRVSTLDIENIPRNLNNKVDYSKDFFGKETFLTVSGQLNAEAYACALSKVYTFGPVFRAENSNTSRHLAEFWMLEPEIAFANLNDIIILAESMLKYVVKVILENRAEDLSYLDKNSNKSIISRLEKLLLSNFLCLDYTEVIDILQKHHEYFNIPITWGMDLASEHERYLTDKYFESSVVIKNYPKQIKAFYMRLNDDMKTVSAMDILVPGIGEIIGGSQREERLEILDKRLDEIGLNKSDYWWYRDLRRYGTVPHAGFGLGFERLIAYITGIHNVREVIPFPRSPYNIDF
ncbi:asparagine--tRNA ligase [Candidatus Ishikawella capsulata]|uniref:Asparagine--tRNA ligase n=1 Tax=Candidatus Ishikawaella capsulata Mpkobe TaxID=476281 RepID=C5WDM3_9ENTR|nr:asparagine--tRNA ligase [Candidatus Ishikawaella capsulata]BAH83429.1 asparaginyl-tRNA synthetase [Candidatus Ishikawaella capsulata Mpkobe]